jgi:hypothetical protein
MPCNYLLPIIYPKLAFLAISGFIYFYKLGKRAVKGLLHLWWEDTSWKLIKFQVVSNTVTALAFSGTGLVGAGAFVFIDFNLTFHCNPLLTLKC